ncbi:MAG: fibronectin type III domain-containing protein [Bacteroidetes bacterium]|nr:fibronectin type III domain-containing protein [Bacteroidota bacterium]
MKVLSKITIVCFVFITACGKSGGGGTPTLPPIPSAPMLSSPLNNATCFSGVNVDANNASITFSWGAGMNAENYDLVIKNLATSQQTTYTVSSLSKDVVLGKNQPYSWYVMSKTSKVNSSAKSEVWKFYVAGNPTSNYAPFPATIIAPAPGSILPSGGMNPVSVTLTWSTTDVDNDIAFYTIYLDNKDASTKVVSSITASTTVVSLTPGKTYYWRVVTTDSAGNVSDSGIYSFSI